MAEEQGQEQVATRGNGLQKRSKGIKKAFLEKLRETGRVETARKAVGLASTGAPYLWAKRSPEFQQEMDKALEFGVKVTLAKLEGKLHDWIFKKDNLLALMFKMKKEDHTYKDNFQVNVGVVGPASVSIEIDGGQHAIPEQTGDNKR